MVFHSTAPGKPPPFEEWKTSELPSLFRMRMTMLSEFHMFLTKSKHFAVILGQNYSITYVQMQTSCFIMLFIFHCYITCIRLYTYMLKNMPVITQKDTGFSDFEQPHPKISVITSWHSKIIWVLGNFWQKLDGKFYPIFLAYFIFLHLFRNVPNFQRQTVFYSAYGGERPTFIFLAVKKQSSFSINIYHYCNN